MFRNYPADIFQFPADIRNTHASIETKTTNSIRTFAIFPSELNTYPNLRTKSGGLNTLSEVIFLLGRLVPFVFFSGKTGN